MERGGLVSETKKNDEIQLKPEEFEKLSKLNSSALRVAQDAEVIVQQQKLNVSLAQKDIRDYLFTLAESHPINPTLNYELDREGKTLKLKKEQ
jgi:ribosomal protein L25 (general stress protein Ctc)